MIRKFVLRVGVPATVTLAFLMFAPASMAQHGGGHGGGGGHSGGGHSGGGGASRGGGGGASHVGSSQGAARSAGSGRENHREFDRGRDFNRFRGGYYPYGYGIWGGFYPEFYYGPDDGGYYGAQWYDSYPSYTDSPVYTPQASGYQRDEFAEWTQLDQRVAARIAVPTADAQLWVDDQEMTTEGTARSFVSPLLESGKYTYTFRARWSENGKAVERTKTVDVQPGDRISVNFGSARGR